MLNEPARAIALLLLAAGGCASQGSGPGADTCDDVGGESLVDAAAVDDASGQVPRLHLEYSVTLDDFCPRATVPETLTDWQQALIDEIPTYRVALVQRLPDFQQAWDDAAAHLLPATVRGAGHDFLRRDYGVALFLCPRLPSVGTPLAINVISYLEEAAPDIPTLTDLDGDGDRDPLPTSLFVAITYHELLHKYLSDLPGLSSSPVIEGLPGSATADLGARDLALLKAHLHLFALRRWVYEELAWTEEIPWIEALEATHGPGYRRAWELVHESGDYYEPLLEEIRAAGRAS